MKTTARTGSIIKPAVWLALFLDSAAFGTALPVIPKLIEQLVHGNVPLAASYYGALLAMSGVLLFFFGPMQAALSDRFGRKRVLMAASFGSAVSFLALSAAGNIFALFSAQIIYAVSGASYPVAASYVGDLSNAETRNKNFSHLSGVLTLGFIVGAALGGVLAQSGLNIAMYAASVSCLCAVAMMAVFFKDTFKLEMPAESEPARSFMQAQVDSFKLSCKVRSAVRWHYRRCLLRC